MSSDESQNSSFATKSSCESSFAEDVSCDSGGDLNKEKSVDLSEVYDTSVEPLASEEEHSEYQRTMTVRQQEQQTLSARLTAETSIDTWCKCGNCDLAFVVKPDECRCCLEIDPCKEKMQEENMHDCCLTEHPAFEVGCLNHWMLKLAGLSYKTRMKGCQNYTTLFNKGKKSESEFFRAVAYRQLVRFVWSYTGSSTRYPLPCCVYAKVRKAFLVNVSEDYCGFQEEESD